MNERISSIGLSEQPLYVADNGCYVVRSTSLGKDAEEHFDIRGPKGEYIGDQLYFEIADAKAAADVGGVKLYAKSG